MASHPCHSPEPAPAVQPAAKSAFDETEPKQAAQVSTLMQPSAEAAPEDNTQQVQAAEPSTSLQRSVGTTSEGETQQVQASEPSAQTQPQAQYSVPADSVQPVESAVQQTAAVSAPRADEPVQSTVEVSRAPSAASSTSVADTGEATEVRDASVSHKQTDRTQEFSTSLVENEDAAEASVASVSHSPTDRILESC